MLLQAPGSQGVLEQPTPELSTRERTPSKGHRVQMCFQPAPYVLKHCENPLNKRTARSLPFPLTPNIAN